MKPGAPVSGWNHSSHGADIGLHGYGATPEEAFEQIAVALTNVMVASENVRLADAVEIRCQAPDWELLLADWLNALVYEMAVRRIVFGQYEVELMDGMLRAIARGESVDGLGDRPAVEIKGATYTGLDFGRDDRGVWHARCVVDV